MGRIAVVLSLAALPLAATACGNSKPSGGGTGATTAKSAGASVQAAVRKTVAAGSEHVAVTASANASGQKVTLTGTGDFDSAQRRGKLHATVSLGVQTSIDEVLDGTTAYVQSPLLSALLPSGKSWLKVDLAAAGQAFGVDTTVLRAQDPGVALAQLEALKGVREVGTQTLNGVRLTHYRGTIDVSKLPSGSGDALANAGASLGPVDVWVGEDGYVHRERLVTTASSSGQSGKTVVTTTLSRFGESVQVSVPAASETVDASKVSIPGLGS